MKHITFRESANDNNDQNLVTHPAAIGANARIKQVLARSYASPTKPPLKEKFYFRIPDNFQHEHVVNKEEKLFRRFSYETENAESYQHRQQVKLSIYQPNVS